MGVTWTNTEVVHLLLRAGFGGAEDEVKACVALGREETVRRLIAGEALTQAAALTPLINLTQKVRKRWIPYNSEISKCTGYIGW